MCVDLQVDDYQVEGPLGKSDQDLYQSARKSQQPLDNQKWWLEMKDRLVNNTWLLVELLYYDSQIHG